VAGFTMSLDVDPEESAEQFDLEWHVLPPSVKLLSPGIC
jgi:hypothetical protein